MTDQKTVFAFAAQGITKEALDDYHKRCRTVFREASGYRNLWFKIAPGSGKRPYGLQPEPEWTRHGSFIGMRFSWPPDEDIEPLTVPEGWEEVLNTSGVYRPDPAILPESAKICDLFAEPDLRRTLNKIMKPIYQVADKPGTYPRAYRIWPEIYTFKNEEYVIEVPPDYHGHTIAPYDSSALVTEEKIQDWDRRKKTDPLLLTKLSLRGEGAFLPSDYTRPAPQSDGWRYFIVRQPPENWFDFVQQGFTVFETRIDLQQRMVLICRENPAMTPPAGTVEIKRELLHWYLAEETDRQLGIIQPQALDEVLEDRKELRKALASPAP